jgi:hypothetical protein
MKCKPSFDACPQKRQDHVCGDVNDRSRPRSALDPTARCTYTTGIASCCESFKETKPGFERVRVETGGAQSRRGSRIVRHRGKFSAELLRAMQCGFSGDPFAPVFISARVCKIRQIFHASATYGNPWCGRYECGIPFADLYFSYVARHTFMVAPTTSDSRRTQVACHKSCYAQEI